MQRNLKKVVTGVATSDGAGVNLTRMIGTPKLGHLDPFLMLDCFESDNANDYIAGFPSHPHRGFETVTYILNGRMRHKDNFGHEGVIEEGGIQWMTAGRGVIHSEMPEQREGLLRGFQLWVNLPAKDKMIAPHYQEHPAAEIPHEVDQAGNRVRVIAGSTANGITGPIELSQTEARYYDISLIGGADFNFKLPGELCGFIYTVEGEVRLAGSEQTVAQYQLGILGEGDELQLQTEQSARIFILAGKPINEPIAWGGPFVMNTREEVLQAFDDFQSNRF